MSTNLPDRGCRRQLLRPDAIREARAAGAMPKITIPSPTVLHFRLERDAITNDRYEHRDEIFDDLAEATAYVPLDQSALKPAVRLRLG